jgi:valyl-tRNA synthetase
MNLLKEIVTAIRTIRSRMNVPPGKKADLVIRNVNGFKPTIDSFDEIIKALARIEVIKIGQGLEKPEQSATAVVQKMELFVPLKGLIDLDMENARLSKRLAELKGHITGVEKKLANENFVSRAPDNVVAHEKQKLQDMTTEFDLVNANLEMLQ